jgi:hypothetical protein
MLFYPIYLVHPVPFFILFENLYKDRYFSGGNCWAESNQVVSTWPCRVQGRDGLVTLITLKTFVKLY